MISKGQKSYYSYLGGSIKYEKEESSDLLVAGYENYIQIISIQYRSHLVLILELLRAVFCTVLQIHTKHYQLLILKLRLLLTILYKLHLLL